MILRVLNSFTYIEDEKPPTDSLYFFTREYTTKTRHKGDRFARDVTRTVSLYDLNTCAFPTGLLYAYVTHLRRNYEIIPIIKDCRKAPEGIKQLVGHYDHIPYDHQNETIYKVKKVQRGIVLKPTGSGKTDIAFRIIENKSVVSIYLVGSIDLLNQTYTDSIACFGADVVGIIGNKRFKPNYITIATIQTLWARFNTLEVQDYLKTVQLVIGDEIHHVGMNTMPSTKNRPVEKYPGNSLYSVIQTMVNAYYRYGFSATIGAESTMRRWFLQALTGRVFSTITYQELCDLGVLSKMRVFMLRTPKILRVKDYQEAYRTGVQENAWAHAAAARIALWLVDFGLTTVIMVNRLRIKKNDEMVAGHAHLLFNVLEELGPGVGKLLTGETPVNERTETINKLKSGKCSIVVGTLLKEGVDIPTLGAAIFCSGNRAQTKDGEATSIIPIQSVGRVTRNPKGLKHQKRGVFVDFYYNDQDDNGYGILARHSLERVQAYKEHGYEVVWCDAENIVEQIREWINED